MVQRGVSQVKSPQYPAASLPCTYIIYTQYIHSTLLIEALNLAFYLSHWVVCSTVALHSHC